MAKRILIGTLTLGLLGGLIWGVTVALPYPEYTETFTREKMGSVSTLDTSILDMAPVQELKVYMKGGDKE